jgi:hypothetical protein
MINPTAQLNALASLANVEVVGGAAWVYGMDYMIAARATRRSVVWEVTDCDANEEIGGAFRSARAAVEFALSRGPIA